MRTIQGVRASWLLGAIVGSLLGVGAAQAEVYTERPGSILIFPKVVRDGTRDTTIKLTNTNNSIEYVHCYYINGAPNRAGTAPLCSILDFDLTLTRQQPTHWSVSTGRRVQSGDAPNTDGAGFDPGLIPPVPVGFTGSLVCVEVDANRTPISQNRLKGEAVLHSATDTSQYNAIAIPASSNNSDDLLDLNNTEYGACPAAVNLPVIPDGSYDPAVTLHGAAGTCVGGGTPGASCTDAGDCSGGTCSAASSVVTNLTFVPCNMSFRDGITGSVTLQFQMWDEFEVMLSGATTAFSCWTSFNIGDISTMRSSLLPGGAVATQFENVRITSSAPVVGIAERFSADAAGNVAGAATNLHVEGTGANARITLP